MVVPSCWGPNSPSWVSMNCLTVNMIAAQSSETPVSVFQSTGRNIIEYLNLQHRIFFISWMSSRSSSVPITKFPFHSFIDWGRFKEQYITWCVFSDSWNWLSLYIRKIKLLTTFMSYTFWSQWQCAVIHNSICCVTLCYEVLRILCSVLRNSRHYD